MFVREEQPNTLKICLESKHCYITDAILAAKRFLSRYGVSDRELLNFGLLLRELMVNALEYGNERDAGKSIYLVIAFVEKNHLKITVEDEGRGFDYPAVISGCCEESPEEPKRGFSLLRSIAERLEFNERGNRVTAFLRVSQENTNIPDAVAFGYGITSAVRFTFGM